MDESRNKDVCLAADEEYIGCKSWLCQQCKHYIKFLTVSTMQGICWNKGCFYEDKKGEKTNGTTIPKHNPGNQR